MPIYFHSNFTRQYWFFGERVLCVVGITSTHVRNPYAPTLRYGFTCLVVPVTYLLRMPSISDSSEY